MDLDSAGTSGEQICAALAVHEHLVLMLDLDDALIPFTARTEDASLDRSTIQLLDALGRAGLRVVIVSGRPQTRLEPLRAVVPGAWWVAEHGTWQCDDSGCWNSPAPAPELTDLMLLLETFAHVPGARLEPRSLSLCLHWRLVPDERRPQLIAGAELVCDEWLETHTDFERIAGVDLLEIRRRSAGYGSAVAWVRERAPQARIIAIGNERIDEDLFAALQPSDLAIGVGSRHRSRSMCRLPGPTAVRAFLRWLVDVRTRRTTRSFTLLDCRPARPRASQAQLLVVSNRTPPTVSGRRRPVSGLVSALEPALHRHNGIWLGWSGHESEGDRPLILDDERQPIVASFDLRPAWREQFYGGFCNRALWPLFHSFPGRVRYSDSDWLAYVAANAEFALHASTMVDPSGMVWVHDYHLLLVAQGLRQRGFRGPIGLFLHIPFPQRDVFETLPWANELMAGTLAFDVIGVHTEQWAKNLRDCAAPRLNGHRFPEIVVLPIGVDRALFAPGDAAPDPDISGLEAALGGRRMILGVDRLDYAKGIPERLLAFECLLERRAEWRGKVGFVQVSVPSREDVPEYAELRHRVEMLVGRINGRFGEASWVPVRYLYRSYDHAVLAQLYRAADVALVTPLRDGLNLVAKEFVVAQDPEHPGVLVLSRFAGAAAELTDAVMTNPYHPEGLADDLDRALRMSSDERRERHARLSAALAEKTPARWAAAFLDRLQGVERRSS